MVEHKLDKLFEMFDWLVNELTEEGRHESERLVEPDASGPSYVVCVTPGWSYTLSKLEDIKFFTLDGLIFALITRKGE